MIDLAAPGCSLIGPHEPPPYRIINETGSAPVVLTGDHVSNLIPRAMSGLGLDAWVLQTHVAYDIGSHNLIQHLSEHLDAAAVVAGYSRLLVDCNRSLSDPSAFIESSDGISVPGNRGLSLREKAVRADCFYHPYHGAVEAMLDRHRTAGVSPALISIHSFTPQMNGEIRPWHVGLLWDVDPRIPVPLMEALRGHPAKICVGDNQPYSGRHPADFTIDHHGEEAGLPHVSIEVRQDLVNNDQGAERWACILGETLRDILADPDLYRPWRS